MLGNSGVDPDFVDKLAFYVIAPQAQIASSVFGALVTRESIEAKVRQRIKSYDGVHDAWFDKKFAPVLKRIELGVLSWEEILSALPQNPDADGLRMFYEQCLKFNPVRGQAAV
jgi:hypothetical protein